MSEDKQQAEETVQEIADRPKAKRKPSKKWAITGAVLVVVAIAGVGFWQWHETPQFCAAFCHNMDQYLEGYEQEQGVVGIDKYGNQVSNTNAMMAVLHRNTQATAKSEIRCMDCHHPVIAEQVSEGFGWLTGNYLDPLDERSGEDLTHWWNEPADNFCANENCHVYLLGDDGQLDRNKLEAVTRELAFNPHAQEHEALSLDCTDCHKGHRASTLVCTGCHEHEDVALPDGWVSYEGSQEILGATFN